MTFHLMLGAGHNKFSKKTCTAWRKLNNINTQFEKSPKNHYVFSPLVWFGNNKNTCWYRVPKIMVVQNYNNTNHFPFRMQKKNSI